MLKMMKKYALYGAILGDLAGQPFEFPPMKGPYSNVDLHNPNAHITDDTIMTLASAHALTNNLDFEWTYKRFALLYPDAGYGKGFREWVKTPHGTEGNSYGNGCIMRASPFMYYDRFTDLIKSVQCSHNHRDSLLAAFDLWEAYHRGMTSGLAPMYKFKKFEVNALETMTFCRHVADYNRSTQANIIKTIECGGDTDTNASIVGELSNYWKQDLTKQDVEYVESKLDNFQLEILFKFNK